MYESPVTIWEDVSRFADKIVRERDEYIFSQIRTVVDVDRDELIKALEYDRDQYYKGYKDRDAEIVRCKYCEHHKDEEPGMVYCPNQVGGWVREDFFCGDGKRREDDLG